MADQGLETEANGFGVRRCTRGFLGLRQENLVNMQRLFHTYDFTIYVWHIQTDVDPSTGFTQYEALYPSCRAERDAMFSRL